MVIRFSKVVSLILIDANDGVTEQDTKIAGLVHEAGKDTARHIPGAALQIVPGMGHDLADGLVPILVDAIARHCVIADSYAAAF